MFAFFKEKSGWAKSHVVAILMGKAWLTKGFPSAVSSCQHWHIYQQLFTGRKEPSDWVNAQYILLAHFLTVKLEIWQTNMIPKAKGWAPYIYEEKSHCHIPNLYTFRAKMQNTFYV